MGLSASPRQSREGNLALAETLHLQLSNGVSRSSAGETRRAGRRARLIFLAFDRPGELDERDAEPF
jgi:hypothetical protein